MITIKNLRTEKPTQVWQVKVDRSSVLGNPFYMATENQRDEVCLKYETYFKKKLDSDVRFREELRRLYRIHRDYGKLELFCWCAPKRCHAETIKKFLERW
jgi:hypothetical protein